MIETSSLNWASKEFSKEVSEIKYLTAVVNDINNHYIIIKNSVEVENKQLEIFFKSLMSNSKSFMNEVSSLNFNQIDSSNLLNISMTFGNFFDLIGKIFCDENSNFNERISKNLNLFSQHLSIVNKFTNEIINFPFKDFSYLKNKKIKAIENCVKSYRELEQCLINSKNDNYSKEKLNEKVFYIFSDFDEKMEILKNLNEESTKAENTLEEVLKSLFYNVIKISYEYLKFSKSFFEEITNYKKSFSLQILNTVTVTIESLTSSENFNLEGLIDYELKIYEEKYNQGDEGQKDFRRNFLAYLNLNGNGEEYLENLKNRKNSLNTENNSLENRKYLDKSENRKKSKDSLKNLQDSLTLQNSHIEVKNLPEISENFVNLINCIQQGTSFKKKIFTTFSKFLSDIFRHLDQLIQNFTKIEKTIYNFKSIQYSNTSYSYIINTSLISNYEFIRSLFDFFFKKQEEILSQKIHFINISNSIETATKEISNEENNFVYILSKLNKEYTNFRNNLTKLVIAKEKIITQIVNNKETLIKLEEASQSLSKTEIALENLKSEESKINDQINEINSNYKRFIEDLIDIIKKSFFEYKVKDKIRFKEFFTDPMVNFMNSIEKAYSNMKEYLQFKDEFLTNSNERKTLRNDLNAIFDFFIKEYLMCKDEEAIDVMISNIQRIYSESESMESDGKPINSRFETINNILTKSSAELCDSDKYDNFYFISKENSIGKFNHIKNEELKLTNLLNEEDIKLLIEKNNSIKAKNKAVMKSNSIKTKQIFYLYNLYNLNNLKDEKPFAEFYVSYLSQLDFIIPGILFVTDRRIVFQSFINNSSNIPLLINYKKPGDLKTIVNTQNLRSNSIEILKNELTSIKDINNTKIKIKTNNDEIDILFNYFTIANTNRSENNIEDFLKAIKKFYKLNDLSNIQESFFAESNKETNRKSIDLTENSSNEKESPNQINIFQNLHSLDDELAKYLNEINFFGRIKEFHKYQYDYLTESNVIRQQFNECFVKDKLLLMNSRSETYIPLHIIYKYIYDTQITCNHNEYNKSKNFILNLKEIRKDYNIKLNYLQESNSVDKIPKYFSDPFDYTLELFKFNPESSQNFQNFLDSLKENFGKIIEYEYKYTHPMKKKFMGPSKLDMHDKYKIIFVSPLCLIVEITTYISGFMMMDSFFTVAQYKYEADLFYDYTLRRISWKTKVNASFAIEFVKECWFRNKIESNGLVENQEYIRDFVLVHAMKILEDKAEEYYVKLRMDETNREKFNNDSAERLKTNSSSDSALMNNNDVRCRNKSKDININEDFIRIDNNIHTESHNLENKLTHNNKNVEKDNSKNIQYILIKIFFVFSTIFAISNLFSIWLHGNVYNTLKELILILLLSINLVFLWKIYQIVLDLQLRLNRIET